MFSATDVDDCTWMKDNQRNTHILASKHEHSYMFESSEHKSKDEKTKKKAFVNVYSLWVHTEFQVYSKSRTVIITIQTIWNYPGQNLNWPKPEISANQVY